MSTSSSYILPPHPQPLSENSEDEIDSLPSSIASSELESNSDDDERESDAEREWEDSLRQLELVLTMVVLPYAGKYLGRRFAYWGWAKYMQWMYPVEVRFTNKSAFRAAGAVEAAATL